MELETAFNVKRLSVISFQLSEDIAGDAVQAFKKMEPKQRLASSFQPLAFSIQMICRYLKFCLLFFAF